MKIERSEKVRVFLEEIAEVCKRHGLSIAHEDGHGAFIVEQYDQFNIEWLSRASEDVGDGTRS